MTTVFAVTRPDEGTLVIRTVPIVPILVLALLILFAGGVLLLSDGGGLFGTAIRLWALLAVGIGFVTLFPKLRQRTEFRFDRQAGQIVRNGADLARFGDITAVEVRVYEGDVYRLLAVRLHDGRRVQVFYGPEQQVANAADTIAQWAGKDVVLV